MHCCVLALVIVPFPTSSCPFQHHSCKACNCASMCYSSEVLCVGRNDMLPVMLPHGKEGVLPWPVVASTWACPLVQVRKAVFDMLTAWAGGSPSFLAGSRWLDLFAGTGSVGLEALSRGAAHCQFIELDSWVVSSVLGPNIEACAAGERTIVHTGRAEAFLQRAKDRPQYARQPFDYIRSGQLPSTS